METLNVVLTGHLLAGTDFETAVEKMAALTRLDRSKVERLLNSGHPTVVKKGVSAEIGEQFRAALTAIGVAVELQPCPAEPVAPGGELAEDSKEAKEDTGQSAPPPPLPPEPISPQPESPSTPAPLPSRSEEAGSNQSSASARSEHPGGNGLESPLKVSASHGWLWIKNCTELYLKEPQRWTGMVFLLGLVMVALSMIPVLGSLVATLVGPVFAGGLMLGAHCQQQGGTLRVSSLLAGFGRPRNQLLRLGAFYLLFGVAIGMVLFVCVLLFFKGIPVGKDPSFMLQHFLAIVLMSLLVLFLTLPMSMAFWFAPCLVALGDNSAWASLKLSFRATLKNWSAFLVYSLILLLVIVVFSVLYGLVTGFLYGLLAGFFNLFANARLSQAFIQIALLALASPTIALFTLSCYTAYRDVFQFDRQVDEESNEPRPSDNRNS